MYILIFHNHCHSLFLTLRRKTHTIWEKGQWTSGGMMRREQEPPGERKEVIVDEKMEEPSAG